MILNDKQIYDQESLEIELINFDLTDEEKEKIRQAFNYEFFQKFIW